MATETIDAAREFIFKKVVDNWTLTPYVFQNEGAPALYEGEDSWTRWSVNETGSKQETLGKKTDRRFRRENLLVAMIMTPINAGANEAGVLAEEARALFEGEEFDDLDFIDGVLILDLGPDKEKKWQQTSVRAAFAYEFKK